MVLDGAIVGYWWCAYDHAVSLHFSESQAPVLTTTLQRLPGQILYLASAPCVDLVIHHVLEPLVVRWAEENGGLLRFARDTRVEPRLPAACRSDGARVRSIACVLQ